jgi:hypothetical protein
MTQAELCFDNPTKIPERGSQCYLILMALQAGERLTTMEAFKRWNITTISQRVGELKRRYGWPVKSTAKTIRPGCYVAEYYLESSQPTCAQQQTA